MVKEGSDGVSEHLGDEGGVDAEDELEQFVFAHFVLPGEEDVIVLAITGEIGRRVLLQKPSHQLFLAILKHVHRAVGGPQLHELPQVTVVRLRTVDFLINLWIFLVLC